jgi:hypothetical protein
VEVEFCEVRGSKVGQDLADLSASGWANR